MTPYHQDQHLTIWQGDCREVMAQMPAESVHTVVTSPPYWGLRDYGIGGQLGLEATPEEYVANMVAVFREVRRVLRRDGTCWVNLGDSYVGANNTDTGGNANFGSVAGVTKASNGSKASWTGLASKNLVGIPWRVAFALQADGWYLRSDVIWSKPNPMPESVTDRPTKAHEYVFLLSKSPRYYYDADAVRESVSGGTHSHGKLEARLQQPKANAGGPLMGGKGNGSFQAAMGDLDPALGRNLRTVWTIATQPYPGAHFATFPEKLVEPCVKAGCPEGGVVLDPFAGSGTTGRVAQRLGRRAVLIDLSGDYLMQAMARNADMPLGLIG